MLHVERKYSKSCSGRGHCKPIGFHANFTKSSQVEWHKKTFKHLWLKFMIWNRSALREEGGISTKTSSRTYRRFLVKRGRTFSFQTMYHL